MHFRNQNKMNSTHHTMWKESCMESQDSGNFSMGSMPLDSELKSVERKRSLEKAGGARTPQGWLPPDNYDSGGESRYSSYGSSEDAAMSDNLSADFNHFPNSTENHILSKHKDFQYNQRYMNAENAALEKRIMNNVSDLTNNVCDGNDSGYSSAANNASVLSGEMTEKQIHPLSAVITSNSPPSTVNVDTSSSKGSSLVESGYVTDSASSLSKESSLSSKSSKLDSHHVALAEPDLWTGTAEEYLQKYLAPISWRDWDPVRDIKDQLSPDMLGELRHLLWDKDEDGEFEAFCAAREGDEHVVALSVFVARTHKQLNTMNESRQTVLHMAAEFCSAALVRLIITRGADGAVPDVWGDTPLHIAAYHGKADVVKALATTLTKPEVRHPYYRVPYKSLPQDNVQSYNHDGRTPVHLAAQVPNSIRHQDTLRALAKHARADMDYRRLGDGYSPAHIAIDNDDYDCLRICLELGADSEVRNFKSETPQQLAYLCKSKDMVAMCQEFGAGEYQLEFAETEPVYGDSDDEMESDECEAQAKGLSEQMEMMAVG